MALPEFYDGLAASGIIEALMRQPVLSLSPFIYNQACMSTFLYHAHLSMSHLA